MADFRKFIAPVIFALVMLYFIGASLGALLTPDSPALRQMGIGAGTAQSPADAESLKARERACAFLTNFSDHIQGATRTQIEVRLLATKIQNSEKLNQGEQVFLMALSKRIADERISGMFAEIARKY